MEVFINNDNSGKVDIDDDIKNWKNRLQEMSSYEHVSQTCYQVNGIS